MQIKPALLALVIFGAYFGLEAFAIMHAKDRTEPDYIYQMLIRSKLATRFCRYKSDDADLHRRFNVTLARVATRYRRHQKKDQPRIDATVLENSIASLEQAAEIEVASLFTEDNCQQQKLKNEFKRYEIYASKSR